MSESRQSARTDEAIGAVPEEMRPARILFVEDEPDLEPLLRQSFRRQLQDADFDFGFARDGMEALEVLSGGQPVDVVLTDLRMPRMDGLTLLGQLKEVAPLARAVVISAYDDMDNIRAAMNLGAFDFLTKPIDLGDVEITIYKTLQHVQEVRQSRRAVEYLIAKDVAESNLHRLRELEALKESLTDMIVHDLRTPLTSVLSGMTSIPVLGPVNEAQGECLGLTLQATESILDMVNDLLDISKLEDGSLCLECETVSADRLVEDAIRHVVPLATQKRQRLMVEAQPHLPLFRADSDKLGRTLVNLVANAIKFTPVGGDVTVRVDQPDDRHIAFQVSDTGEGIPPTDLATIFHKFGQVQSRKAGHLLSTGLGLTFSKMIAEAHGGRIEVVSDLGHGSVFTVLIPLAAGPPE